MKKHGVMLVGLCGRSGSGKGYVASLFARYGIPSVDTDAVYREMTSSSRKPSACMEELSARFGKEIVLPDNSLNRPLLREMVFGGDGQALRDLNRISHAHILRESRKRARRLYREGSGIVLIDAPLLYESGFDAECECVVAVTAPEDEMIRRITERDGITEKEARTRLESQIPAEELVKRADFVIGNDVTKRTLMKRVRNVVTKLERIRSERYSE